jgi:hypothetical protein
MSEFLGWGDVREEGLRVLVFKLGGGLGGVWFSCVLWIVLFFIYWFFMWWWEGNIGFLLL